MKFGKDGEKRRRAYKLLLELGCIRYSSHSEYCVMSLRDMSDFLGLLVTSTKTIMRASGQHFGHGRSDGDEMKMRELVELVKEYRNNG